MILKLLKLQIGAAAWQRPPSKAWSDGISENEKKNDNKLGPGGTAYEVAASYFREKKKKSRLGLIYKGG